MRGLAQAQGQIFQRDLAVVSAARDFTRTRGQFPPPRVIYLPLEGVSSDLRPPAHAVTVPPGFVVENAVPGFGFNAPVAVAFLPDGRWLVAERRGRVFIVQNGVKNPTPLINIEAEVLYREDRGLMSLAVDPDF